MQGLPSIERKSFVSTVLMLGMAIIGCCLFLYSRSQVLISSFAWRSLIWKIFIPLAKSLVLWKLLRDKLPIDNEFQYIFINLCSTCSVCNLQAESPQHIFNDCHGVSSFGLQKTFPGSFFRNN